MGMKYLDFDLGHQPRGAVAQVTLRGNAANVLLLDAVNFQNYRSARDYKYIGGHAKRSPINLQVPHGGHWHVVVDLGGYGGHVDASVDVLG
jgi:hypothetical protein